MGSRKTLERARGRSRNLGFDEVARLAEAFGFRLARTRGSHHIFVHDAFPDLLNLQSVAGQAKPYQVRQLLQLVERYNLVLEGDD
jgi:predicted RNA binding protein YcfA (HicA-like mRNA interferase family)